MAMGLEAAGGRGVLEGLLFARRLTVDFPGLVELIMN
jgi:hypothetical protein